MATQAATQAAGSLRATAADDSPSVSKQDQHPQSPATPASGVSALFARLRSRIHGKGSGTSKTHPEDPLGTRSPAASSTYSSIGLDDDDDGRGQSSAIGSGGVSGYESDDDTDYNSPTPATATATATASVSNIASKTGDSAATAVPQVRSIAIKGVAKAAAASALSIGRHSSTSVPVDLSHATTALRVTTDATAGTLDVCGCDVASVCGASRSRTRSFGNRLCEELARDKELMVQDVHIPAAMLLPSPLNAALGTTPSSMIGGRSPPMSAMSGGIGGGASSLGSIRSIGSTHDRWTVLC
ncbi:hypothetical protein GQ42DRAFT_159466 [Ramicandelaber brevisporus]|nr:hypothetical protein GQ42DRAFT_159466 [Ramicandelaber brevisporus]